MGWGHTATPKQSIYPEILSLLEAPVYIGNRTQGMIIYIVLQTEKELPFPVQSDFAKYGFSSGIGKIGVFQITHNIVSYSKPS